MQKNSTPTVSMVKGPPKTMGLAKFWSNFTGFAASGKMTIS